ncbi:MAG: hypothetical protein AAGL89_13535 [Pseudomonadota bacterium]
MHIVFKHIRDTNNIGDRWCSPFDHAPALTDHQTALDLAIPAPACDAVIFGGGKIARSLHKYVGPNERAAAHRIAWGISTVQSFRFSPSYWRSFQAMSLVGSRDWGDKRFEYAPCASVMSPLFEKRYDETHDTVAYLHRWKSPKMAVEVPDHIPQLDNSAATFEEVIAFLGSARTVVSNSYHGVFWSLVLGKKVLCLPFSNKFMHYRIAPGYSTPQDWVGDLTKAQDAPEMYEICLRASATFTQKVKDLIYG